MQSNRNICSVMSASKRVSEKDSVYDSGLLQFSKKEFLISWQTSQLIWVLHCPGVNINIWIPWLQISIFEQPVAGGLDVMERTPEIHSYTALLDQKCKKMCESELNIFYICRRMSRKKRIWYVLLFWRSFFLRCMSVNKCSACAHQREQSTRPCFSGSDKHTGASLHLVVSRPHTVLRLWHALEIDTLNPNASNRLEPPRVCDAHVSTEGF